jgi:general secretion pathway protein H
MPTSAPGPCSARGFTLIELLVVLLIMGLLVGLASAIVRPDARALLRGEAERLAQLLELAAVEARLTGRPIAWTVMPDTNGVQYRFSRWRDDAGWLESTEDSLRPRSLPAGMAITDLRIEAARARDGTRLEFSPHGALAYDFRMSLGEARTAVAANPLGDVRILASPDAPR